MNLEDNNRVPAWCPICERVMKGSYSTNSFYNFGCCHDCYIEFVEDRVERWNDGWRPSKEDLERFYKKIRS